MYLIRIGILLLTLVFPCVIGLCRFGSGPDCAFRCNCAGEAACDQDTGDCGAAGCAPGHPDGYDWTGAGCQTGNVAYKKPANQTGVFRSLEASEAVDGIIDVSGSNANCAHPDAEGDTPAEWIVDLGALHLVQHLIIHNTYDKGGYFRLEQFEIFVEATGGSISCGRQQDVVERGHNVTIECPESTVGRYVRFQRYGGKDINLVTLCEVVVWGHRYIQCGGCGGSSCDPVTGCPTCPSGKRLPDCLQDCSSGKYGEGCELTCGRCQDSEPCDVTDGRCPIGCEMWYRGDKCSVKADINNYGDENTTVVVRSGGVEIIWEQQKDIVDDHAQYYGYSIEYQRDGDREWTEEGFVSHKRVSVWRTRTISGLEPGHSYNVRIRIYTLWDGTKFFSDWPYPNIRITIEQGASSSTSTNAITSTTPTTQTTTVTTTSTSTSTSGSTTIDQGREPVGTSSPSPPTTTLATTPAPVEGVTGPSSGGDGARTVTIAVAVVVTLVVLVALSLTIFFVIRSQGGLRRKKTSNKDKLKMSIQRISDGVTVGQENPTFTADDIFAMTSSADVDSTEAVYENTDIARTDPILLSELQAYVQAVRDSLLTQYKKLPEEDHSKCRMAETDENKLKNRFLNIHAYEHSRVELPEVDDDPDSVYINANYIKGYNGDQEYIATQGPKPNTFIDFWRMVWTEQCDKIVMVTNLVENTKVKCDQYWPSNVGETLTHNTYTVTMETEEHYADYKIRIFTLKHEGELRTVRHFHFTSWEDKKRPLYGAAPLLAFRHKIRSTDSESSGPLLVHCSAGVGRTGTLIALDILLQQAAAEEKVEIFNCVRDLRKERMNMVQTKDQYVFLHDALLEAITSGNTTYPRDQFPETYQSLCEADSTELERQFTMLKSLQTKTTTATKDGWKEVNRHKNRDPDVVPEDTDRPHLTTRDAKGNSYINAVYTDSFRAHDAYLVTQMPLPSTQSDFWRLVYDHKVATIVMLDPPQPEDESCSPYWPEVGTPQKYGPILVELISESTLPATDNIVQRDFQVSLHSDKRGEAEPISVRQLQWLGWALDSDVPEDKSELYSLYAAQRQASDREIPSSDAPAPPGGFQTQRGRTLVHCLNGAARSGLYCVWAFVLDKLRADGEVDVFLGVRYVASRRPQLMESPEQYRLLYDLTADVLSRSDYENL